MGLNYPGEWKFEGIGFGVPAAIISDVQDLITQIADGSKSVIEQFKAAFGVDNSSSSYDWAITDLYYAIKGRTDNAALFVDTFWKGIEWAKAAGQQVPSENAINKLLAKHRVPLKIVGQELQFIEDSTIVDATEKTTAGDAPVPVFVLGDKIGEGGYGVVYKATRSTVVSDFVYALKILDPSAFVEDYDKALQRFRKEIKALQSLQHRAIVQYFEAGVTADNKPYIVMPYIAGTDLRDAAAATDLGGIVRMFTEILYALEYAHSLNVIHRDLKPSNIIVRSSDNQPIILDFGAAYIFDQLDPHTLTTQVVGTIGYIPSEVLTNPKKRSPLHDIYAFGVMLYEAVASHLPDPGDYQPLSSIDGQYAALDNIVKAAIAGESTRTKSAATFAQQLAELQLTE